jgi:hypothetical protein
MPEQGRKRQWTVLSTQNPARSAAQSRVPNHGLDRLDARDGLFGEGESESDSAEEFAVDIHRTAAHTLQNAGLSQSSAAQAGQDDGLPWSEILEDSEDLDLEIFDAISFEDRFSDSSQSRTDIADWEEILMGGRRR